MAFPGFIDCEENELTLFSEEKVTKSNYMSIIYLNVDCERARYYYRTNWRQRNCIEITRDYYIKLDTETKRNYFLQGLAGACILTQKRRVHNEDNTVWLITSKKNGVMIQIEEPEASRKVLQEALAQGIICTCTTSVQNH